MAYKILSNSINPKDFVKAHMTQGEIVGMEMLQGGFTSIDKKTGLREFSHLIPIFKHKAILNLFESVKKQLTEYGELSPSDLKKYRIASKAMPKYIETATEKTLKSVGRGEDKHVVLLPKEIANFFIKINHGKESRNPETGYLEFGKTELSGGRAERTARGGVRLSFDYGPVAGGGTRGSGGGRESGNMGPYSNYHNAAVYAAAQNQTAAQNQAAAEAKKAQVEQERRDTFLKQEKKEASHLQYVSTLLGYLLGGPIGASLATLGHRAVAGQMTPDQPTRTAPQLAAGQFGNPFIDMAMRSIGNYIADKIPQTPQKQLTEHLKGNYNPAAPYYATDESRVHYGDGDHRLASTSISPTYDKNIPIEELLQQIRHPSMISKGILSPTKILGIKTEEQKEKERVEALSPFQRHLELAKQKQKHPKSGYKERIEAPQEIKPTIRIQETTQPLPALNNQFLQNLTSAQKDHAIQEYEGRNPINPRNPFEAREDPEERIKKAFSEFFQHNRPQMKQYLYGVTS